MINPFNIVTLLSLGDTIQFQCQWQSEVDQIDWGAQQLKKL